jgi:hypothetical protein
MTSCAMRAKCWRVRRAVLRLPAHDGPAGIGRISSSRLQLAMES